MPRLTHRLAQRPSHSMVAAGILMIAFKKAGFKVSDHNLEQAQASGD